MNLIDLRSDTVTRPSKEMLEAMFQAEVGDDVFEQDPTVNELQAYAASLLGTEAALFCPSGTMTNQIGIKLHTSPPCQVIVEQSSHTYLYEGGGIAFNSGGSVKLVQGDRGRITAQQVEKSISPDDVHLPQTQLVSLENTCNRGGGSFYDFKEIVAISKVCRANGLKLHLDGARLFNALSETEDNPKEYGKYFDTISICLSKGLGAPVGSLLLGSEKDIRRARRLRKLFGGGMRQAGYLAAAGLFALKHNVKRLKIDHQNAKTIESQLLSLPYIQEVLPVDTNIIVFELTPSYHRTAFLSYLETQDILAVPFGENHIRFVTHLDIGDEMISQLCTVLQRFKK